MRKSKAIFDINSKGNVVARASMRNDGSGIIMTQKFQVSEQEPTQCSLISMVAYYLGMIREEAEKDPSLKGRYTFIVPESIAFRMFQAQSAFNAGNNIIEELYLDWMKSPEYNITSTETVNGEQKTVTYNAWESAITDLATHLTTMLSKDSGFQINFMNARQLYRWQILDQHNTDSSKPALQDRMEVTFSQGVDKEHGFICRENNFLNGTFTVMESTIRDRNGGVRKQYHVPRYVVVNTPEGRKNMTVGEIIALPENERPDPVYENGAVLVNAALLRMENAKQLPRINVGKFKTVSVTAEAAKLQF